MFNGKFFVVLLFITAHFYVVAPNYAHAQAKQSQLQISQPTADYPLQKPIIDTIQLRQFQADPNFQYEQVRKEPTNIFDRFITYLLDKIRSILTPLIPSNSTIVAGQSFWDIFMYLIIAIALVIAISKLLGADLSKLFFRATKKQGAMPYQSLSEDINSIDFVTNIDRAIQQKQYREAIRLYYLQTLKILSDKDLIQWQAHKTNRQYRQELKNNALKEPFNQLTRLFDYVWYGEFLIDDHIFEQAQNQFKDFMKLNA